MSRFSEGLKGIKQTTGKAVAEAAEPEAPGNRPKIAAARVGKKNISGYFDRAVWKQLRIIAIGEDLKVQEAMAEAFNLYFEKHGLPPIAKG